MTTKRVEYAYPTSANAVQFGFGKTGCYVVELCETGETPVALAAFSTLEKARAHAERFLTQPWDKFTK